MNGVASYPSLVSWIKHSVDRFVIVSIFIPKLRLILILNSFFGSSDSLVFRELFHSLAPRPLAARSIFDYLLTYFATQKRTAIKLVALRGSLTTSTGHNQPEREKASCV